ncbi:pyridoxal 5'-phosphate synthase glutaminase subunit PdxT [Actinomarinicola tropica]|uniref:Pyridoxal 5'-phosphate synthase subunit PdxT n=1 Tax=Actinomarinicola tropica TaxID=2789776 RepID=A0A5Q2RMG4_9ACTN|nr:pyridoxal 5'-phosphate synthase glutaminase subunit PdxT [Actinomarinicola tropica]
MGLLALQGAVEPHARSLARLGASTLEVRRPDHLADVDALVLPGGESTTISMLLDRQELRAPLAERLAAGMPALGTCAGMILLASEVLDGRPDQRSFGAIDLAVRRNGFGRQVDSFEADLVLAAPPGADPFHAVFIRAPVVERVGDEVEVLAAVDGSPVLCRQGNVIVSSFHPELSDDTRIHQLLVAAVEAGDGTRPREVS